MLRSEARNLSITAKPVGVSPILFACTVEVDTVWASKALREVSPLTRSKTNTSFQGLIKTEGQVRLACAVRWCAFVSAAVVISSACGSVSKGDTDAGPDASSADASSRAANLVFITPTTHAANFGSVSAADSVCNETAELAGLSGQYVAWLSSADSNARARMGSATGWVRVDGKPFAQSLADIAAGKIYYPPELAADGTTTRGNFSAYWTGSDSMGQVVTNTCGNWTSIAAADRGTFGVGLGGAVVFTQAGSFTCDREARFLCLGTDRAATITPPNETGRTVFLSERTVIGGAGVSAFNLACQADAEDVGLDGTFVAGVSGFTDSIDLVGAAWVRPDGTPVTSAELPLTMTGLVSPITQSADGSTYRSIAAWTGVVDSFDSVEETCTDWSVIAGTGSIASTANASSAGGDTRACDTSLSLFCFEL